MADLAIRAEGLGKSYRIDHQSTSGYRTLRESITSLAGRRPRQARENNLPRHETIWALKDVSFEVQRGDVLGIIGRNGAGKSTLLKILSRITTPTSGRAEVTGRLGSLLEVGTGFHPELTGRENIFLNGSILGMRREEIRAHFDEIVSFAETERFLDTPVKRYSTGMYLRLAFAVAAHLETDVLIVDEVLAVGDAAFQQKCIGKMSDVAGQGRTVLFVSHNMAAISRLCANAVLLDEGHVSAQGPTDDVVASYLAKASQQGRVELSNGIRREGSGAATFRWGEVQDGSGQPRQDFSLGEAITIRFGVRLRSDLPRTKLAVAIRTSDGLPVAHVVDDDSGFVLDARRDSTIGVTFTDVRLYPGSYWVSLHAVSAANTDVFDLAEDCLSFRIVDGGKLTLRWLPRDSGLIFFTPEWHSERNDPNHAP
jgi:lipopolysaccharide transport system ATP-binding protein